MADASKYDVKLTTTFNGTSGALLVEEFRDGNKYRQYIYNYDDFYMPTTPTMPKTDPYPVMLQMVAWVRQAMIELGFTDQDADPAVASFVGLTFQQRVMFDQFLAYMSAMLHQFQVLVAQSLGGYNQTTMYMAWIRAAGKLPKV